MPEADNDTVIHDVIAANEAFAAAYSWSGGPRPSRALTVVACMDTRLEPYRVLGLRPGEAHIIRNAGGLPTDDVLRSLSISQRRLGTRSVILVHHTDCGMQGFDDEAFRAELATTGVVPGWVVPGFSDPHEAMRNSLAVVRNCQWLPHRDAVRGFVYDVTSGRLAAVD
jgi:carbonic anhydrase